MAESLHALAGVTYIETPAAQLTTIAYSTHRERMGAHKHSSKGLGTDKYTSSLPTRNANPCFTYCDAMDVADWAARTGSLSGRIKGYSVMAERRPVITLALTPNAADRSPSASCSSDCSATRDHSASPLLYTHIKPSSRPWGLDKPFRSSAGVIGFLCVSGLEYHHRTTTEHAGRQGAVACAHIRRDDGAGVGVVERGQEGARVAVVIHVVMQAPCIQPCASAHAMECIFRPV